MGVVGVVCVVVVVFVVGVVTVVGVVAVLNGACNKTSWYTNFMERTKFCNSESRLK